MGTSAGLPPTRTQTQACIAWIERHGTLLLCAVLAVFTITTLFEILRRPLWYDEMFTYTLTIQPNWHLVKLGMPADGNPPLYVFLARLLFRFFPSPELGVRFPSLVGYVGGLALLYRFVRKRSDVLCGLIAVLLLCTQSFTIYYAGEARPYGLILFFTSLALFSWQAATDEHRPSRLYLLLLAVSVAGAVLSHHLGMCSVCTPIYIGELVRTWKKKRIDWPIWIASIVGLGAFLVTLPMAQATRREMLEHVFANQPVTLGVLQSTYRQILIPWALPFLLLLCVGFLLRRQSPQTVTVDNENGWPTHELAAILAACCSLLPVFAILRASTGYYAGPRYAFAVFYGLAALSALIASRWSKAVQLGILLFLIASIRPPHPALHVQNTEANCFAALPPGNVAVARALYYPSMWHYSSPQAHSRLFFPYGVQSQGGNKSNVEELALVLEQPVMHMQAIEFHQFLASNRQFLLLDDPFGIPSEVAFHDYLAQHGYSFEPLTIPACLKTNLRVHRVSAASSMQASVSGR